MTNTLSPRHIGLSAEDKASMLATLGVRTEEELIGQIIPKEILLSGADDDSEEPVTEQQHLLDMNYLAEKNKLWKT